MKTTLRTNLQVKTKVQSGVNMDFTIPKGANIISVITQLIKYVPMDCEEAKKQINATLDKEINRVK